MKIKSLVSLLADAAPPSCPTSRTHPELAFNTSVRTIFGKMVKNTASKKSIKNQSFIYSLKFTPHTFLPDKTEKGRKTNSRPNLLSVKKTFTSPPLSAFRLSRCRRPSPCRHQPAKPRHQSGRCCSPSPSDRRCCRFQPFRSLRRSR